MSSSALDVQGSELAIGDGASPEVFAAVGEINSMSGPSRSRATRNVTDFDSTAHEFKPGLLDNGEVTFELFHLPADTQHADLITMLGETTPTNFRITFTDSPATTWTFPAYVTGFSNDFASDDDIKASVTLKVTGAITEA